MKLQDQIINRGETLFKYRGQMPLILLLAAIPVIFNSSYYNSIGVELQSSFQCTAIFIACCGLCLRYYTVATSPDGTSGKNRKKQVANELNTTGVYSIVRNPLYLANYLIWLGISIYSLSYILIAISSLFFFIIYEKIILVEEFFLTKKYGEKYEEYSLKTPCFFPNINNFLPSNSKFSIKKVLREEYSSTLSTIMSFIFIDILIYYIFQERLYISNTTLKTIILSICIACILKLLKKNTKLLN
ncbi:MAG: DUF1295 domain-containing protein [Flavobacteriales bacterium TMED191]|nr:MAG: DUF1295 domain-containing protein [Flavobacteriales bacterium TMED191]